MTDKEQQLMDYVISAQSSIHDAIAQADVRPLANALRKLQAMQILIEAPVVKKEWPEVTPIYETPEQPKKFDLAERNRVAREILGISDEVQVRSDEEEPKPKRKKRVRLDDFDTPLSEKEEAMDRVDRMKYWRKCGKTYAWIAEKEHCSPQTVLNILNREKAKEEQRLKSEAAYSDPEGGRKR